MTDTERLDWLESAIFNKHWDGCINRPCTWELAGPYRHALRAMRGNSLRDAIDHAKDSYK